MSDMNNIVDLSGLRQPVHYTVYVSHAWSGELTVEVHDISTDQRSRDAAANALRRAADMLSDPSKQTEIPA